MRMRLPTGRSNRIRQCAERAIRDVSALRAFLLLSTFGAASQIMNSRRSSGFLDAGGEMGERIRRFDWGCTSLGPPDRWPASLRTAVRLMLNTNHPVFLFWGPELLCLYNDAYSQSIGPEQHPAILGMPAKSAWSEIWHIIEPQISQVMSGLGSTWHENQLIPITRFGRMERVYWTYSYAPIHDDPSENSVGGVMVLCTETTKRVLAEERSRAEELRWRSLFVDAPGFMCVLNGPEHRFAYANPALLTLIGKRDIIGRVVVDVLPEIVSQGFLDLLDTAFVSGVSHAQTSAVVMLSRQNEESGRDRRIVDFVMQPIRDVHGTVTGVFVQGSDVTDRELAQGLLRESEQRYRALADSVPAMVWVADTEGWCEYANRGWSEFTGSTPTDGHGLRWFDAVSEEDQQRLRSAVPDDARYDMELQIRRHDGVYRWFQTRCVPRRNAVGEIDGWYCTAWDVDERRNMVRGLQQFAERLSIATDAAELGIHQFDVTTGAIEWDARVRSIWGVDENTPITYELFLAGVHPDDREHMQRAVDEALNPAGSGKYVAEYRVIDTKGTRRWVRATGRVQFEHGEAVRLTGTVQDISNQKETELALIETDRRKDIFLATLAHELRNPLAPIRNAAQLLASPAIGPSEILWAQQVIQRQSSHMATLLDDLLDVARLTKGRLELRRERIAVEQVIAAAVETVQPMLTAKEHRIAIRVPGGDVVVYGDMVRLCQVLANLLTNAIKYTDPRGEIEIDTIVDDDAVTILVADSGIGIAPEMLPDVFGMFQQSKSSLGRAEGGLGIGLALVRSIVELHGGTVHAHSAGLGKGSQFRVTLPRASAAHPASVAEAAPTRVPAPVSKRILIADDNTDAAESLAMWFGMHGHIAETAGDGEQCLVLAASFQPQVVIVDIGMPKLNGYEVASRLRAGHASSEVRLIAMTGWGQPEDRARALAAGFDAHFTKPPDLALLTAELTRE
jgi:PAS domain S-box-containing protein